MRDFGWRELGRAPEIFSRPERAFECLTRLDINLPLDSGLAKWSLDDPHAGADSRSGNLGVSLPPRVRVVHGQRHRLRQCGKPRRQHQAAPEAQHVPHDEATTVDRPHQHEIGLPMLGPQLVSGRAGCSARKAGANENPTADKRAAALAQALEHSLDKPRDGTTRQRILPHLPSPKAAPVQPSPRTVALRNRIAPSRSAAAEAEGSSTTATKGTLPCESKRQQQRSRVLDPPPAAPLGAAVAVAPAAASLAGLAPMATPAISTVVPPRAMAPAPADPTPPTATPAPTAPRMMTKAPPVSHASPFRAAPKSLWLAANAAARNAAAIAIERRRVAALPTAFRILSDLCAALNPHAPSRHAPLCAPVAVLYSYLTLDIRLSCRLSRSLPPLVHDSLASPHCT